MQPDQLRVGRAAASGPAPQRLRPGRPVAPCCSASAEKTANPSTPVQSTSGCGPTGPAAAAARTRPAWRPDRVPVDQRTGRRPQRVDPGPTGSGAAASGSAATATPPGRRTAATRKYGDGWMGAPGDRVHGVHQQHVRPRAPSSRASARGRRSRRCPRTGPSAAGRAAPASPRSGGPAQQRRRPHHDRRPSASRHPGRQRPPTLTATISLDSSVSVPATGDGPARPAPAAGGPTSSSVASTAPARRPPVAGPSPGTRWRRRRPRPAARDPHPGSTRAHSPYSGTGRSAAARSGPSGRRSRRSPPGPSRRTGHRGPIQHVVRAPRAPPPGGPVQRQRHVRGQEDDVAGIRSRSRSRSATRPTCAERGQQRRRPAPGHPQRRAVDDVEQVDAVRAQHPPYLPGELERGQVRRHDHPAERVPDQHVRGGVRAGQPGPRVADPRPAAPASAGRDAAGDPYQSASYSKTTWRDCGRVAAT